MLNEHSHARLASDDPLPFRVTRRHVPREGEYSHILIPTALKPHEQAAVVMGMQLAAASRASVTLLHVVPIPDAAAPPAERSGSWHWLDAIDSLHHAWSTGPALQERMRNMEQMRSRILAYVDHAVPEHLRSRVNVSADCREGDIADEILRFAGHESVDLVILSSELSRWGLPIVPSRVHRMLQQIHKRVVVVHRDAVDRRADLSATHRNDARQD